MQVQEDDVRRAIDWLVEVEGFMPDIFKDMNGKSDDLVIQDMHSYLWQISYIEGVKKPFHRSKVEMFLMARTPAYNIKNIIDACIRAQILLDKGADIFMIGNKRDID